MSLLFVYWSIRMNDNRYVITYEQFVRVFGGESRIDRIKRLRNELPRLGLKEAKWVIDNCIGSLGKKTLKVVDPDGYEHDMTYPMGYMENVPFHTGETLLFEMRSGANSVQLLEGDEGLVFVQDVRGERTAIRERILKSNLDHARERLDAAYREVNRCRDEVDKWGRIDASFEKVKTIAQNEGLID